MEYFSNYSDVKSILKYGVEQTHHTLSVVIPTYHKPIQLKRAIQSAIDQLDVSIDYNIVIIENSEGDVSDVISMLSTLDNTPNIQIVYYQNEKNIGMHPNWNRCFEMADADYALMLHTDDYFLPYCISCAETVIKKNLPALTIGRFSLLPNRQDIIDKIENAKYARDLKCTIYKETYKDILSGIVPVAPTGFLVKKDFFIQSGGFNTKAHSWPADLELCFNYVEKESLYFCTRQLVVKTEGDGNDGSDLKTTVPLVCSIKDVFYDIAKRKNVFFYKMLIGMRLASISRSFHINYDQYLKDLFPRYYLNRYYTRLFLYVRRYYGLKMKLRKSY